MKVIHKSIGKLIMVSTLILTISGSFANAETILLNFATTNPTNPALADAGWLSIWYSQVPNPTYFPVRFTSGDLEQTFTTVIGSQIFTLQGAAEGTVGSYINGDKAATSPVTGEGFYVSSAHSRPFSLSGFSEGDQISVYAISAWDGNSRAGMVTIGSETTQALAVDFISGLPTIDNFTLINNTPFTVSADGLLTGFFNWNTAAGSEGQIGGLILVVTPVPEPSTWLLLAGGVSLLAALRRRCR
ncbi:MAG: PEP-CTERM sorting domain-containing protein [Verrucomicrobiales bacterium]|jgi:hypothetical protein|nr:PEP-CTERM sorting domain-containing protein [Verrucomicrobiales bacterium]